MVGDLCLNMSSDPNMSNMVHFIFFFNCIYRRIAELEWHRGPKRLQLRTRESKCLKQIKLQDNNTIFHCSINTGNLEPFVHLVNDIYRTKKKLQKKWSKLKSVWSNQMIFKTLKCLHIYFASELANHYWNVKYHMQIRSAKSERFSESERFSYSRNIFRQGIPANFLDSFLFWDMVSYLDDWL